MTADLLSIGKSGLFASKKSLATTSHNISNVNTEGYSRQQVKTKTNVPLGQGDFVMGSGVNIQSVKRVHDTLIEKRLNSAVTDHSFHDEKKFQLERVEEVFNETTTEGINKVLNRFFNSFRELANQPENETVRAVVRDNAKIVMSDFQRSREQLREVRAGINNKIQNAAIDINTLSHSIAKLNKDITRLEISGGETGDLRDQRDLAVKNLAEYMDVHTYEDEKGQFVVSTPGAGSLVTGGVVSELKTGSVIRGNTGSNKDESNLELYFADKPTAPITENIRSGKISALKKARDEDIQELEDQLDQLAYTIVKSTNAIHKKGFINEELPLDENGNPYVLGSKKMTGIEFFKDLTDVKGAADLIDLSNDVKNDLNNIATALSPNSPGDNRVAIAISKLQHEKIVGNADATLEEHYLKSVGKIGLSVSKARIDTEQSMGILAQAKSIKERISGVSIDEETANMVKYQHAYEASARVIRAADEMFQTVLGIMR